MSENKLVEKYPEAESFLEVIKKTVLFEGLCHPPCTRFADSLETKLSIHKSICEQEEPWKYLEHNPGQCPDAIYLKNLMKYI